MFTDVNELIDFQTVAFKGMSQYNLLSGYEHFGLPSSGLKSIEEVCTSKSLVYGIHSVLTQNTTI
jgi:hypothetical protein